MGWYVGKGTGEEGSEEGHHYCGELDKEGGAVGRDGFETDNLEEVSREEVGYEFNSAKGDHQWGVAFAMDNGGSVLLHCYNRVRPNSVPIAMT